MADLVGSCVGNYVLLRKLGAGGMGTVYLARHPEIGLEVAVKVLAADLLASEDAAARFLAEAKALTRVMHPGIVRIQDFGRLQDGRLFYMMEALAGQELETVLATKGPLSPEETLEYLEVLCPALQAAHDRGVVHRDLKPSNIIVLEEEELAIKILDFGIAKLLQSHHQDVGRTGTGLLMGTPLFIAPEQAAGQPDAICPQTDIYAIGVILFFMLSGKYPIIGENAATLLYHHITQEPIPLRDVAPRVSDAVARVVRRCLAKPIGERFASARELLTAFREAVATANAMVLQSELGPVGRAEVDPQGLTIEPYRSECLAGQPAIPAHLPAEASEGAAAMGWSAVPSVVTSVEPPPAPAKAPGSSEQRIFRSNVWLLVTAALVVLLGGAVALHLGRSPDSAAPGPIRSESALAPVEQRLIPAIVAGAAASGGSGQLLDGGAADLELHPAISTRAARAHIRRHARVARPGTVPAKADPAIAEPEVDLRAATDSSMQRAPAKEPSAPTGRPDASLGRPVRPRPQDNIGVRGMDQL